MAPTSKGDSSANSRVGVAVPWSTVPWDFALDTSQLDSSSPVRKLSNEKRPWLTSPSCPNAFHPHTKTLPVAVVAMAWPWYSYKCQILPPGFNSKATCLGY
jgi:hypothetical protein